MLAEFRAWPKIPRGTKGETITITEKLDGTNACVIVAVDDETGVPEIVGVQSRKRIITPEDDNYGFAGYVSRNHEELSSKLGEGYHYGEWYGNGIQGNPHNKDSKRLALFNSTRWRDGRQERPEGVECVPVLFEGDWHTSSVDSAMTQLWYDRSNDGIKPEGIVVWFHKTRRFEKHTFAMSEGKWKGE